jgi:dihydrofolate synthase / folylpolyglutamate synthase
MNYKEATTYILEALPMYQRIGSLAYKADLENAYRLDEHFGHPHQSFKTIHIAGTNGKGSVSHMLASVLQCAGYKTGLFTSPHLLDFRERIRVNGQIIPKRFVTHFTEQNKEIFEEIKPSFFEMSVFMCFAYFAQQKVDIAIIEVGLGGRLDTTNIIKPEVSVITNIGLDHTQILGTTMQSIAREKGGIIKSQVPVIIGESHPETRSIFEKIALQLNCRIFFSDDQYAIDSQFQNTDGTTSSSFSMCPFWSFDMLDHDLSGYYQRKNIPTVLMTLSLLQQQKKIRIKPDHIREGLLNVMKFTGLAGRWQIIGRDPLIICDTAHNAEGFIEILRQIRDTSHKVLYMILGFVEDKSIEPIIHRLPTDAVYCLCEASIPRAMKVHILADSFRRKNLTYFVYKNVAEAFQETIVKASADDLIYLGGSTFVVADFLAWKKKKNSF